MATVRVIDVIRRVEDVLQDNNLRWPRLELQDWLNEAYLSIILMRPDANTQTGTFTCVAGTRQKLDAIYPAAFRLVDIVRNLAATSNKRVVRQVSRGILDDQRPEWHSETETVDIQHFMFDPRLPKEFLVYPPATLAAELEVVYSAPVAPHAMSEDALDPEGVDATTINLDDIYFGPILDWILYRAYSKDAEYGANDARSGKHYSAFGGALTAKSQVDSAIDPKGSGSVT